MHPGLSPRALNCLNRQGSDVAKLPPEKGGALATCSVSSGRRRPCTPFSTRTETSALVWAQASPLVSLAQPTQQTGRPSSGLFSGFLTIQPGNELLTTKKVVETPNFPRPSLTSAHFPTASCRGVGKAHGPAHSVSGTVLSSQAPCTVRGRAVSPLGDSGLSAELEALGRRDGREVSRDPDQGPTSCTRARESRARRARGTGPSPLSLPLARGLCRQEQRRGPAGAPCTSPKRLSRCQSLGPRWESSHRHTQRTGGKGPHFRSALKFQSFSLGFLFFYKA